LENEISKDRLKVTWDRFAIARCTTRLFSGSNGAAMALTKRIARSVYLLRSSHFFAIFAAKYLLQYIYREG